MCCQNWSLEELEGALDGVSGLGEELGAKSGYSEGAMLGAADFLRPLFCLPATATVVTVIAPLDTKGV
jgi:hypothetical protein